MHDRRKKKTTYILNLIIANYLQESTYTNNHKGEGFHVICSPVCKLFRVVHEATDRVTAFMDKMIEKNPPHTTLKHLRSNTRGTFE